MCVCVCVCVCACARLYSDDVHSHLCVCWATRVYVCKCIFTHCNEVWTHLDRDDQTTKAITESWVMGLVCFDWLNEGVVAEHGIIFCITCCLCVCTCADACVCVYALVLSLPDFNWFCTRCTCVKAALLSRQPWLIYLGLFIYSLYLFWTKSIIVAVHSRHDFLTCVCVRVRVRVCACARVCIDIDGWIDG